MPSETALDTPPRLPALPERRQVPRGPWAVLGSVVFALSLRELKTRLDGRWGGAVWVVGEPLLNMLAMLAIYGAMRAQTVAGVDTLLFLVTGQLPFLLFKSLALRSLDAIDSNLGLFAYRQVQPIDAVLARGVVEVLVFGAVMLGCLGALGWIGHAVLPARPLELVAALALLVALGGALGLLLTVATAAPLTRLRGLVAMAFLPLYVSSGALMPLASLPAALQDYFLYNPLTHLLDLLRSALIGSAYHASASAHWTSPLAWALGLHAAALGLYRARRHRLLAS